MDFRLALIEDLPQIKGIYMKIVQNMINSQIAIWDDIYPCDYFQDDIDKGVLYLLLDQGEIVSAFALCDKNKGEKEVRWSDNESKALYLDRFGVNVEYLHKGIGVLTFERAKETAKTLGASFLRLFVVDINKPAINLYVKFGFIKADGVYDEVFDDGFVLHQYGYEIKL